MIYALFTWNTLLSIALVLFYIDVRGAVKNLGEAGFNLLDSIRLLTDVIADLDKRVEEQRVKMGLCHTDSPKTSEETPPQTNAG